MYSSRKKDSLKLLSIFAGTRQALGGYDNRAFSLKGKLMLPINLHLLYLGDMLCLNGTILDE